VQSGDVLARALGHRGVDPAGQHRVYLDVVARPGAGEGARELHDAALARAVGRDERRAEDRHHRADVDDLAAARALEMRIRRLRGDEGAGEVRIDHELPFFQAVFLRLLAHVHAGVVDEDVEPAEPFCRFIDHRAARCFVGQVCFQGERLAAERLDGLRVLGLVPSRNRDHGPGLRQALGHAQTDAAVAAGDERGLAVEIEEVHAAIIQYLTKASIAADDADP
jgi:hypothetical protein